MKIITQKEFLEKFNDKPVSFHFKDNTLYLTADNIHYVDINQAIKQSVSSVLSSSIKESQLIID